MQVLRWMLECQTTTLLLYGWKELRVLRNRKNSESTSSSSRTSGGSSMMSSEVARAALQTFFGSDKDARKEQFARWSIGWTIGLETRRRPRVRRECRDARKFFFENGSFTTVCQFCRLFCDCLRRFKTSCAENFVVARL